MIYNVVSPLYVTIPRKRKKDQKVWLNVNVFHTLHFRTYNKAKEIYSNLMKARIEPLPRFKQIKLEVLLYPAKSAKGLELDYDVDNKSMIEKFFLDCLQDHNKIEDDNYRVIPEITRKHAGFAPPRKGYALIRIKETL